MTAWGYDFYLLMLIVYLTSEHSKPVRDTNSTQRQNLYPHMSMLYPLYTSFMASEAHLSSSLPCGRQTGGDSSNKCCLSRTMCKVLVKIWNVPNFKETFSL